MADEQDTSTSVAEGASTSAPAESVEETQAPETSETSTETAAKEPQTADDVWNFDDVVDDEPEAEKAKEAEPAKPEKTEEKKPEEKQEEKKPEGEETDDDDPLAEAFSDAPEKKEGETEEEDIDKADPQKVIDGFTNKSRREWAERNAKKAEIVKDYQFDTKPIAEVAAELQKISEPRYAALKQHLAHELVDANPEATFHRAYAVTMLAKNPNWDATNPALYPKLDDLVANGVPPNGSQPPPAKAALPADLASATADLDSALGWDWRNPELDDNFVDERELAMAKTLRVLEAKATEESAKVKDLDEKLKGVTTSQQTAEEQALHTEMMRTVGDYRTNLEKKILPYIFKNTGLEVSSEDIPEMKEVKELLQEKFTGREYDRTNGYPSPFESFAYSESTVREQLLTVIKRLSAAQAMETKARVEGNKAEEDKFRREALDEELPLSQLLGQAHKEFKKREIDPFMNLIGRLSKKLIQPNQEASQRTEVTSNGSSPPAKPPKKDYATADEVWGGMVEDAAREERLRAEA